MSGIFGSTTIKGTRITDFAKTSADVGSTIPFLYGRAPVTGNVIFAALPPKENRQVKRQGKGGVKQETFTYTTSYAIAFCRGPIQGYWWIKRNGKVVYSQDPAAPIEDKDYAAKWAAKVMMYNGTSSQMPSSMIEAIKGTGRVSAFRYLAYIAVPDEDVTDGGGAIPSYEAVPIASPAEVWITSTPYAQVFYDNARAGLAPTGGELVRLLYDADMQPDEVSVGFGPTGGELKIPPPGFFLDSAGVSFGPTGGELKVSPPQNFYDAATVGFAPTGGSLAVPPTGTTQKDEVTVGFGPTGGELYTLGAGNAIWNASDKSSSLSLSNGGATVSKTNNSGSAAVRSLTSKSSGKWALPLYIESFNVTGNSGIDFGVATASANLNNYIGSNSAGWGYDSHAGNKYHNARGSAYGAGYRTGDTVELLLDCDAGTVLFTLNGVVQNGGVPMYSGLTGLTLFAALSIDRTTDVATARSNLSSYAVSNGFLLWS